MIDRNLLNYPEQLAARLTQMERDIQKAKKTTASASSGQGPPGPPGPPGPQGPPGETIVHPYSSLERLRSYLYRITFETYPAPNNNDYMPIGGCSSFVRDGKLYRNYDWDYSENATFHVVCSGFQGIGFMPQLNDSSFDDDDLGQLPYHLVDGVNEDGIMCSTHIIFNDWDYTTSGAISASRLPYIILSSLHSMADIDNLRSTLANLNIPSLLTELGYLPQYVVTDGTTTYVIAPPEASSGSYELINATSNPKLTNFRWVNQATVDRQSLQTRPTGVERWNSIGNSTTNEDLRFTLAYQSPDRLSEFIGIRGTDKYSSDVELTAIYNDARVEYLKRQRDGITWQSMHSVVYSNKGMEHLWVQEDYNRDYTTICGISEEVERLLNSLLNTGGDNGN